MRLLRITRLLMAGGIAAALSGQTVSFFPRLRGGRTVAADANSVYVAGEYRDIVDGIFTSRAVVRKYDAQGAELWSRQFNEPSAATALAVLETGVYVAGTAAGAQFGLRGGFVRRYDSEGNELWTRRF